MVKENWENNGNYQSSGANGLNAAQPQNSPVDLLRGKNISTEQDAANAIRELRAKNLQMNK